AEDFAVAQVRVRHNQRSRERTPKMADDAQLKTPGQVGVATKGNLIGTVKSGRSEIADGISIVEGVEAVILVVYKWGGYLAAWKLPTHVLEAGPCVRYLQIQAVDAPNRVLGVFRELHLQSV